jgi:tetratricopeptide (TPR) repeat protein
MKLAEALLDAGDLARSGEQYRALAQIPATEPAAQYGLGRIASAQQKWADAVPHLRRACELFPEYGAAHYALGLALRNLGQLDDAQRELALHRQYGPRWPALDDPTLAKVAALKDDGHAHLERGIRLGTDGKLEDAITEHELALVRDPALAQAHANLITLYGRLGNVTKAEEHYEAVVAMKSNLDEAHYNYGVVLALAQRDTEAAEALRQAIAVNPSHAQAHNTLGALLERERRWDAAADEYRQAVTSQPALRLARFNLGRMLIVQQRYDEAIAELGRVIDPDDAESPRYVYALATAYLRAGQREPGMKYAAEARRRALAHDQAPLAAAIEKELASLQAPR